MEGAGDLVLTQVTRLVTEMGLVLPTSYKVEEPDELSLHEVSDQHHDEVFAMWEQLRVKLKAFCSAKLQRLPNCSLDGSAVDKVVKIERSRLVQGLSLLYQPVDVLQWYGQLRKRQLESNSRMPLEHCLSTGELGKQFFDCISVAERMMSEDLMLLQDRYFMEATKLKPTDFLKNFYLSVVLDKVRNVLSQIAASSGVDEKSTFSIADIVTISELMSTCRRFDDFLLTVVTFSRSPSVEPVMHRRLSAILKSPRRPLDVVSSIQSLKQLPPIRAPLTSLASGSSLRPIQESLSDDHEISKSHSVDAVWVWQVVFEPYMCLVTKSIEVGMMSAVQGFIAEEETRFKESSQLPDVSLAGTQVY